MNIVIIGNGFDLSHNLKTNYKSFIKHVKENSSEKDNKFEQFYTYKKDSNTKRSRKRSNNTFFEHIERSDRENWCNIEAAYFNKLNQKNVHVEHLNKEFKSVKDALEDYLVIEDSKSAKIDAYNSIFSLFKSRTIAINFNYTNTLKHYSDYFSEVIHIHGELKNPNNPIIFGYAANKEKTFELLEKDNDSYLEFIKQYEYLGSDSYQKLLHAMNYSTNINVFIFGHSCGLSDQLILKTILEHKSIKGIINFYYKGIGDHKNKLININRCTSEKLGFNLFEIFPKCIPMPQADHDYPHELIEKFRDNFGRTLQQK